jgi:ATP-dependent DNA ligase
MSEQIKPMLAKDGDLSLLSNDDFVGQIKYDGTGIWVIKMGNVVKLWSARSWKNNFADANNPEHYYSEIVEQILRMTINSFKIHAELTFYNKETGKEEFITALAKLETRKKYDAILECHDIVECDGEDVSKLGYMQRHKILSDVLTAWVQVNCPNLRVAQVFRTTENKKEAWEFYIKMGREGLMFKRKDSPYEFDTQSKNVLKLKKMYIEDQKETADCVIVGVTKGNGKFKDLFGALILAQYKDDELIFVGKCSGMNDETRASLFEKLKEHSVVQGSFTKDGKPSLRSPYCECKGVTTPEVLFWTKPEVAVEIFYHTKADGFCYRFPEYSRIRDDKPIKECKLRSN